jgi:hypothetical protein
MTHRGLLQSITLVGPVDGGLDSRFSVADGGADRGATAARDEAA